MDTTEVLAEQANNKNIPQHVAIIMDGNGRWAQLQGKGRVAGHKAGVQSVRAVVTSARKSNVKALTLFAFSSENWQRPEKEVSVLMDLFMYVLTKEVKRLHKHNIRFQVVGDLGRFSEKLQKNIAKSTQLTAQNTGLVLSIAANYGGQWDIEQAAIRLSEHITSLAGQSDGMQLKDFLSTAEVVDPDLFIRTGGEQRISNFLLMQLAYSELYFTDTLWPDFNEQSLLDAINDFSSRQRRFGQTGEQINQQE